MIADEDHGARGGDRAKGSSSIDASWLILQRLEDVSTRLDTADHHFERMGERLTSGFDAVDRRFESLTRDLTSCFDAVDRRLEGVSQDLTSRFDAADRRTEGMAQRFDVVDHRFDALEQRMDSSYRLWQWTFGVMFALVTGLLVKVLLPGA